MASDLQLALEFVVRDLGSDQFSKIAARAQQSIGVDVQKAFDQALKGGERMERALSQGARGVEELGARFAESLGPVGSIVGDVTSQVTILGGGIEHLIEKAGLGAGALAGISVAAVGILAVGRAIEGVAEESEHLEKILGETAARTSELVGYQERLLELKEKARNIAAGTGLPQDDIAAALAVVEATRKSAEEQRALIEAAVKAQGAHQGPAAEVAQGVIRTQVAFGEQGRDPREIANDILLVADSSQKKFLELQNAINETGILAHNAGLSSRDTLALIGSAAKNSGEDVDKLRQGLDLALRLVGPEGGDAHDVLAKLGVDFSNAGKGGAALADVFQQIRTRIDSLPNPNRIWSQLGDSKGARALQAILRATSSDVRQTNVQFELARQTLDTIFEGAGSDASAKLARANQEISNDFQRTFDTIRDGWAAVFGKDLVVPADVKFPEQLAELAKGVQDALSANNPELARTRLEEFKKAGTADATAYGQAFKQGQAENLRRQEEQFNRGLGVREPGERRPEFDPTKAEPYKPPFTLEKFSGALATITAQLEASVNAVSKQVSAAANPIELAIKAMPPPPDALIGDIDQILKQIKLPELGLPTRILPPDVSAAQADLERIRKDFATYKQVLPSDKAKAADDEAVIKRYIDDQTRLRDIIDGVNIASLSGLDKQAAGYDKAEASLKKIIAEYHGEAAGLKELQNALAKLQQTDSAALDKADQSKRAELDLKRLEVQAQALEKARDLARASGEIEKADSLGVDAINARAAATARANEIALQGIRDQAKGYSGLDGFIDSIGRSLADVAAGDKHLAELTKQRAEEERKLASAAFAQDAADALLAGLDKELAAIRRNRLEAEKSARAALLAGKLTPADFASAQQSAGEEAARAVALARRNADLNQLDAISNALGSVTNSYANQVAAIDLTRAAERIRFQESLANAGTEKKLADQLVAAFDRETAAKKRQAAISFAGQSAGSLAEQGLLNDAAIAGQNLTLQEQIDLISQAKDGADAWSKGWEAGTTDAVRSLNDFDTALQGSQDLVLGFRDSIVTAFSEIGQKGKNPLKDFLTGNLQNIQKILATSFSNKLTAGLFGPAAPNKAGVLDPGAAQLNIAGTQLIAAAAALQAAAISLSGAGFSSSLSGAFNPSDFIPNVGGFAATPAGGFFANGGIFNGIPTWARGLSPKANRVGGVYGSRTLIEVAEVPGMQEAVIPLHGGKVPVELNDKGAAARQRSQREAQQRVVDSAPSLDRASGGGARGARGGSGDLSVATNIDLGGVHVTINATGQAANDPRELARVVAEVATRTITLHLEKRTSNRLTKAVRSAVR